MRTLCKDTATTTKQSEEAIASQFRAMESKIETRFQRAQTTLRSEQVSIQTIGTFCVFCLCCVLPYLPPLSSCFRALVVLSFVHDVRVALRCAGGGSSFGAGGAGGTALGAGGEVQPALCG